MSAETGYLCPDNDQLEVPMRAYRIDRLNRTHKAVTLDFTLLQPIDDTAENAIFTERWGDGGWLHLPATPWVKNPCTTYNTLMKAAGLKEPLQCPIPAGNFTWTRRPFVDHFVYNTPFWSGRFKIMYVMRRIQTKQKILCTITITHTEEKLD